MTFDFQLGHACPHVTIEESVALQADRRSLYLRQPISSSDNIRITANNEVNIPKEGVLSYARLVGFQAGPFRIVKNENLLEVSNRQGIVSCSLSIGTRVVTTTIVSEVQKVLNNASINIEVSSQGGFLVFEDKFEKGPSSFVRVGGSALKSLGMSNQVCAKGKEVYPGWFMDEKPAIGNLSSYGVKTFSSRYPKFKSPIKGNPVLKVTYATFREMCLRCRRTGVENDPRVSATGNYLEVRNEDLLNQISLKSILTIKGSNRFFPEYGSLLTTRIGAKNISGTQGILQNDVNNALERVRVIQRGQSKYQTVSPRERLESIQSINVFQSDLDLTAFGINAVIRNASSEPVSLSVIFTVPGSVALQNSRGQSLGAFGLISGLSSVIPG